MNAPDLHSFRNIHAHTESGPDVITSVNPDTDLTAGQGSAWFSVGVHPWDTANPVSAQNLERLNRLARDPRVVAIGECGLDALRGADAGVQEEIFLHHIRLAREVGKPLIIHCVRRFGRLLELRARNKEGLWIVHGFRGKPELARQLAAAGIAISLGPTTPREKYADIPDDFIYFETDK